MRRISICRPLENLPLWAHGLQIYGTPCEEVSDAEWVDWAGCR